MRLLLLPLALVALALSPGNNGIVTPFLPETSMGAHCLLPRPVVLRAQEGNPGHKEPPPGWTCAAQGEHACSCHRECKDTTTENEDGTQGPTTTTVVEDPKCRVFCFANSCRCPVHNCE